VFKGGRFEKIEEKEEDKVAGQTSKEKSKSSEQEEIKLEPLWIDHGAKPNDVHSLVFNIFLYKINVGLKLDSRTILSLDGNKIYVVIKADDGDLKRAAEQSQFTMQLAIGLTDLTSFEPCDRYYRPFRKCENIYDNIEDKEKELYEYFAIVEGNIQALINETNLDYQPESGIIGDIHDDEWDTYSEYLNIIQKGYSEFKDKTYKRPHNKGSYLETMANKAIIEANKWAKENGKAPLYNLWQRLGFKKGIGAYSDFEDDPEKEYLWRKYINDETMRRTIFRDLDRIKLTEYILSQLIKSKKLVSTGYLAAEFSFHNEFDLFGKHRYNLAERENYMDKNDVVLNTQELFQQDIPVGLTKVWNNFLVPPFTKIRNYFGEKIGMYFAYLSYWTIFLIFPSIIGIPAFIMQVIFDGNEEEADASNAFFAGFVIIWSALFYEAWKRREVRFAVIWGQIDFEEDEVERVDFVGIWRRSPINDRKEYYFSSFRRGLRILVGIIVTLMLLGLVLLSIWGLLELRTYLFKKYEGEWFQNYTITVVSTINAFQIVIFNQIYNYIAFVMTGFENHKTITAYEQSLILKTFIFQFINSFNSIFYIAFLKREFEGCLDEDSNGDLFLSKDNLCSRELYGQLRSIFIVAIIKNIMEIGMPIAFEWLASRSKKKYYKSLMKSDRDSYRLLVRCEQQMDRGIYAFKEIDGTYFDYLEIMIQTGYILLFGLAFPLCCVLAVANNIIEQQVDRAKLVYYKRRPSPLGALSIGVWRIILYFISVIGIFTYAGVLCITTESFSSDDDTKFIQFLWCAIICAVVRWSIAFIIPDVPRKYHVVLRRHAYVISKFLVGLPEASKDDDVLNDKTKLAVYARQERKYFTFRLPPIYRIPD
jgi:anoctamin-10